MLEMKFMHWTYAGARPRDWARARSARGSSPIARMEKSSVLAVDEHQWQSLVKLMGNPEWASEEIFKDRMSRAQNMDALKALMSEWISQWKVTDLYKAAQEARIPFRAGQHDAADGESDHLQERKYFVEFDQPG